MDVLILRLQAPLMAFGATAVDNRGVIDRFPAASMLTGLLANALGFDQSDGAIHDRLQQRLIFAARLDKAGQRLIDYQTVDLGQPLFDATGWTTWGRREDRRGGPASSGTHIRFRHYWAGACCTIALRLQPLDETPTIDDLAIALERPARPLFIGRKSCLPSGPLLAERQNAVSVLKALERSPLPEDASAVRRYEAQWPATDGERAGSRLVEICDTRDWTNQFHSGRRFVFRGEIEVRQEA